MELSGVIIAIIATIGFGTVTVFTTRATRKIGALESLCLYQAIGIPFFLFLIPVMPQTPANFSILPIMGVALIDMASYVLFLYSTTIGQLAVVGTLLQVYMIVTTVLGVWFLGESFPLAKIFSLILIFCGILLFGFEFSKVKKKISLLSGVPHALLAGMGVGIYLYFVAIVSRTSGWFFTALIIRTTIALTSALLLTFKKTSWPTLLKSAPWKDIVIAGMVDVGAFSLYNYAVSRFEVSTITIIVATQSVVTVILSHKLFGDQLSKRQLVGFLIILAGFLSLQLL